MLAKRNKIGYCRSPHVSSRLDNKVEPLWSLWQVKQVLLQNWGTSNHCGTPFITYMGIDYEIGVIDWFLGLPVTWPRRGFIRVTCGLGGCYKQ